MPKPIIARARRSAALIAASSAVTAASAGRGLAPAMRPRRRGLAALSRALAGGFAAALSVSGIGHAAAEVQLWRCTNPQSGAQWTVSVDFARAQVDSLPATITEKWISWHDPKQGFFDLERDTGKLQLRNASSTGGYFLHYLCQPGGRRMPAK